MPVSIREWRVRIGRFIHRSRENDIQDRKEKLLKERIRLLKLLEKRLLEKKEKSEDECESKPNDSSVKVDNAQNESTIKENTAETESTTYHKNNGTDSTFRFFFTLLLPLFSLLLSLIFFFVFDLSNLLESSKPFLKWSGESSWRITCLIIISVCSSLACINLSHVIQDNDDLQDNLVAIKDNNVKDESTIKVNNTTTKTTVKSNNSPTESNLKENNTGSETIIKENSTPTRSTIKVNKTPTASIIENNNTVTESRFKEKNTTIQSTKECKNSLMNSTIKERNTPSIIRDEPSERKTSKTTTSNSKVIKEENTITKFTIGEKSAVPESKIRGRVAPKECHINTLSTMTDKPSRRKTPKRKTLTSKRKMSKKKTAKEKKRATKTTIKANNSPTEEDNMLSEFTSKEKITLTKSTLKKDNTRITESIIKENNSPSESNMKKNNATTGYTIIENNTPTESTIKVNNTSTESTIKETNTPTESSIKVNNIPTESSIKVNNFPTESTIKENSTPTESTIKENNTPTESTIKENNTPTESTIKENNSLTESTIKENNSLTESTNKNNDRSSESTIKDYSNQIEFNITDNNSTIQSLNEKNNTTAESTSKDSNTPTKSTNKENDTSTESTLKGTSSTTSIKDNGSPTESTNESNGSPTESTNESNNSTSISAIKEKNTPSRTPTGEKNSQPMKVNSVQAEYTIRSGTQKVPSDGKHSISSQIPSSLKGTTDDPVMQESTCLPEMILVKAGDVEQNPGPFDRSANIQEQELVNLAYDVPSSKYTELCIALDVSYNQSQTILDRHLLDFTRSLNAVFFKWKDRQRDGTDCRQVIAVALRGVNLDALGDKMAKGGYLPQEAAPTESAVGEETQPLTKEQVDQCAQDFRTFYRTRLCKIKTDPVDFNSILEFDRIYTNLVLLRNKMGTTRKTPLDYTKLLTTKVNGVFPKRLMVEGEGGAGKTTFCSKIAWDWAERTKEFEEFDWVLVIPFRNTKEGQTVGDIAKTYLSDSNTVQPCQIDKYILSAPSKVFIIFDGLDEYEGDILKESSDIAKILRSEKFVECRVLVTTRPWRAVPYKSNEIMMQTFVFLAIAGFDKKNISTYINKYFQDEPPAGHELINYIESNDLIQENMAPFPLYIAMLCILWRNSDADKRKLIRKLKTFSQLFTAMIIFLKDHCLTKQHQNPNVKILTNKEMNNYLSQIGKIAYSGVLEKKLMYTENDFSGCDEAMEACCRIGVLSREILIVPRQDRCLSETNPVTSSIFFPHKLFQEYLAGMYLASLFESEHEQYEKAMNDVINRPEEFRNLLYFTASQTKNVAIDVTNMLIKMNTSKMNFILNIKINHILVDIAFEAYDDDAAKVVGQYLFAEQKSLEIDDKMSPHTVSGYLFIMEKITMETMVLSRRSCGPTVSRDLAEVICSSTALKALELSGTALHDDFYGIPESKVNTSKVERLSLNLMNITDEHASRNLAIFVKSLPRLKDLTLQDNRFDGQFYEELASGACLVGVERLSLKLMKISDEHASRNLARFLKSLPGLKDLTLQDNRFDGRFYEELASGACLVKVGASGHSVRKLHLDHRCHNDILQHAFTVEMLFPNLEHLRFTTLQTVSPTIIGSLAHSGLKELSFRPVKLEHNKYPVEDEEYHVALVGDPSSLEKVFMNSFPLLTNFTLKNLVIGNNRCKIMLSSLKQHQHLEKICVIHCYTDEELDPIVSAINMEYRMKVDIQHYQAQKRLSICMKMSSSLADALCHQTSIQELSLTDETIFSNAWFSEKNQRTVDSKISKVRLKGISSCDPTASRDLARFICLQPCLTDLTITNHGYQRLHDDFFHEIARSASSSKILKLFLGDWNLKNNDPTASRDLARFLCLQPCLTDLTISNHHDELWLHDDFYHEIACSASSSKIQKMSIKCNLQSNDPTSSRDLARFIFLQPFLTTLTIKGHEDDGSSGWLHDEFYHEIASLASSSKIQKVSIDGSHLERNDPTASRDLARFFCLQPFLTDLTIQGYDGNRKLHDNFYHELARLASSSEIQKVSIDGCHLERNDPTASCDLARFICLQPFLTDLTIQGYDGNRKLHDDFYHELARLASSSKVTKITIRGLNLDRTASCDLARFLCLQPCLTDLTIRKENMGDCPIKLHDEFYHELARLASSSKVRQLTIGGRNLIENDPSASHDLARFLCRQPCLTDLTIQDDNRCMEQRPQARFHDEFYHELARLAFSSNVQKLTIGVYFLIINHPTSSLDLARFLCCQPCLTSLTMHEDPNTFVHDDFYHELARLASSTKVKQMSITVYSLDMNKPSASRDLARFLCLQPCLTDLAIQLVKDMWGEGPIKIQDDFYHELARLASSSKVQKLSIGSCNLERNDPTASRDLAMFLCLQPSITDLTIQDYFGVTYLHDDFYQELARHVSSSKVQKLTISGCNLERNTLSASLDLARFLCLLPCLTDLTLKNSYYRFQSRYLHDDFYHELARLASSSKIGKLCIEECNLKKNDPSASRAFAKFLCLLPCLTDLTTNDSSKLWLHDDFYYELALLASSSRNPFFTNNMTWTTWCNEYRSRSVLPVPSLAPFDSTNLPGRLPSHFLPQAQPQMATQSQLTHLSGSQKSEQLNQLARRFHKPYPYSHIHTTKPHNTALNSLT